MKWLYLLVVFTPFVRAEEGSLEMHRAVGTVKVVQAKINRLQSEKSVNIDAQNNGVGFDTEQTNNSLCAGQFKVNETAKFKLDVSESACNTTKPFMKKGEITGRRSIADIDKEIADAKQQLFMARIAYIKAWVAWKNEAEVRFIKSGKMTDERLEYVNSDILGTIQTYYQENLLDLANDCPKTFREFARAQLRELSGIIGSEAQKPCLECISQGQSHNALVVMTAFSEKFLSLQQ